MKCFIVLLLTVLLYSCGNSKVESYKALLSSNIKCPESLTYTMNGTDTLMQRNKNEVLRLIVYMNKKECGSCRIKSMYHDWIKYIDFAEKIDSRLSIVFILNPKDENDLRSLYIALKSYPTHYPVFIDKTGDFEKQNPHLPKDNRFHTFLIDSTGKVLCVGSPTSTKSLEQFFFRQ